MKRIGKAAARLPARGWWWLLDYCHAGLRQLDGLLFRADPAPYRPDRMAALVAGYLREADLRSVTIVAHSKGGLVGKHAMLLSASAGRILHMVAVNSPFSGSTYARLFLDPSIRALSPRNRGLRALSEDRSINHRITSVFSTFDPRIPVGSHLPGARNIELDSAGHFRTLDDPSLPEILLRALAEPEGSGHWCCVPQRMYTKHRRGALSIVRFALLRSV